MAEKLEAPRLDRRALLGAGALAGGAALAGPLAASGAPSPSPVAETVSGKVRGYADGAVLVFKGVRYGADTGGDNRWKPPRKPAPWAGVQDATAYGFQSPQPRGGPSLPEVWTELGREPMSEDCLFLNVWTPALTGRRPVVVWFHGGGYTSGSGAMSWFDGTRLARRRDLVVVTVNHRLNVFGHLYLGEAGGADYADSGNAGMLDCVAALEWVRDNISAFGGDPGRVTIFGQSGGAGKVSTLMGMVPAKGLFHRALAMSGNALHAASRDEAAAQTRAWMGRMGLGMDQLRRLSVEELVSNIGKGAGGGPVVDGRVYPRASFDGAASPLSADVPFVIGSTATEVTFMETTPLYPMGDAELRTRLERYLHAGAGEVERQIALYRRTRPDVPNTLLHHIIASDYWLTADQALQAERKAAQAAAPAYLYFLQVESTARDGRLHTPHALDIPYFFDNLGYGRAFAGEGDQRLADAMSASLAAFAATGDPNAPGLPSWPKYDAATRPVMILDHAPRVENDPRREERLAAAALKAGGAARAAG